MDETLARIRGFERGAQDVRPHASEVDCYYEVVNDSDGGALLHLSTFGSDNRQSKPKSSQVLQLDKETAAELMAIIKSVFPGLA